MHIRNLVLALPLILLPAAVLAQDTSSSVPAFRLVSSTFSDGSTLPNSTIDDVVVNGVNTCSIDGSAGGDQSPELSWSRAPLGAASFVVTLYDTTASFTHWGMYNIAPNASGLPAGAGVVGSKYGEQILNDFGAAAEYDGPCPPSNVAPDVHRYVFTVYALDTVLSLPSPANFPANAETLEHALFNAALNGHVLATATLGGVYSSTTPSSP
jgi:Raf kinase inhibitor-like YbhB/YbcL family protein